MRMGHGAVFETLCFHPETSYLQRVVLKTPVSRRLGEYALFVYRRDELIEQITLDFDVRLKAAKKNQLYFHFEPEQNCGAELFSATPQLIVNFSPRSRHLNTGDELTLKLVHVGANELWPQEEL